MDEGLVRGHAYSITKATKAQIETPRASGLIPLIRIRNPWGNEAEWNGAWSDRSAEWQFIPDEEKENLGLTFEADGEFWMSYKDFGRYWDQLEICNLSPDSIADDRQASLSACISNHLSEHFWIQEVRFLPKKATKLPQVIHVFI